MDININTMQQLSAGVTPLNAVNSGASVETQVKNVAAGEGKTPASLVSADVATVANNPEKLQQALSQLNTHVQAIQRNLQFSVDHGTMVVKIVDIKNNQVIQQIPTEAALNLAQALSTQEQKGTFNIFSSRA